MRGGRGGREGGGVLPPELEDQDKFQVRQKHNHKTSASFSSGYFDKQFLQPTGLDWTRLSIKIFKIHRRREEFGAKSEHLGDAPLLFPTSIFYWVMVPIKP